MAGPTPGQVLNGRYELRRRIGGGSMGEVWRGRDLVLGRTVAVKIVLPALLDEPTFRARFVAEARVMAMMDHPGIVGVFDYGYAEPDDPATPGAAFLVMEFIEGESLDRILARTGPLEPRFALKVLASLLDALAAVHRAGVVHRDVKPANVMLTAGGVVLADFGIARSAESLGLTAADALMGTVPYLAPELFQAETPTPAADVYAVGILGYELLSGQQPFQAASTAAVMYKHMHEPPPPLPEYVAAPAAEVLWRALEKDASRRWTDGAAMAVAIRQVLTGPVEVGEEYGAGLAYGRGHAGNASGYEDTLAEGGRRRPGGAATGGRGGGPAAVGYGSGHDDPSGGLAGSAALSDSGGRHGRASYGEPLDPLDRPDPLTDSGGRHGRAAAFGEDAASDIPDATRVFETEPVGRHASPTSEIPLRRRAVEASSASPAPRADTARRRALVTAAVAVPALLGLTVALVVNASGSTSPSGGNGTGPGVGQPADLPTSYGTSRDDEPADAPSSSSSAYYQHTAPGHGRATGTGSSSGTPTQSATSSRSSASSAPFSSLTGPSSGTSSAAGATPTLTAPTSPTSSATTPDMVTVPGVVGSSEGDAKSKLTGLGFRVVESPSSPTGSCKVTDQSLPANSSQPYGSAITLTLSCS